jgi:vitamin K-dependent gamma-carboxylase-like protein
MRTLSLLPQQLWDRFWFTKGSPRNLAAARIVFAMLSLWVLASRDLAGVCSLPAEFWAGVPAGARWRYLDFAGHARLEYGLQRAAMVALFCALIGVLPRLSCFISGILLYHLAPLETIIWTSHPYARGFTISVLALLTLSFSPCGDCWTLVSTGVRKVRPMGQYNWPIRLIQLFLAQVYLFSGYAKLFHSGWRWASASNLSNWMLYFSQQDQVRVFHSLGAWLAYRPLLCQVIGIGTLIFEIGFIFVLFSPTARLVLVPMAVLFHIAILVSMNLVFLNVPQLLVFADWDRVAAWRKSEPAEQDSAIVEASR